jgi:hypothetical protein
MRFFVCLAMIIAFSSIAKAQQSLPQPIRAAIQSNQKYCDQGKFSTGRDFITRRDINGDGVRDYILNYEHVTCGESTTVYCGTGGCAFQVFASLQDGSYVKVMDDNAYNVRFERVRGRPAMIQILHGSHCGRAGADGACRSVTYWNGSDFSSAAPIR